jgi:DNA-binding CsgD family transcriptional regulator
MASKATKFSWAKVNKSGKDDCWPWDGAANRWGYGVCQLNGVGMNASRAAYITENGPLGIGLVVCHRCDNPICCNPNHLFAATQRENLEDCRAKGRQRYLSGAEHRRPTAKMNAEIVRWIRSQYSKGLSQSEIGRILGISSGTISRAVRGESWGHVQ